jgi:PAS domain S-box-containing protein
MKNESNTDRDTSRGSHLPRLCQIIFDSSPLPMAAVEGDKHILRYVNPAFCRLNGTSTQQLIGKPFGDILPGDGCLSSLDQVYRTGEPETHADTERAESTTAYWSYAMWPLNDAEQRTTGVVIQVTESAVFHQQATAMNEELLLSGLHQHELIEVAGKLNTQLRREMTDRKRLEEALVKSEKLAATARLASTMSHEINNPLEAITNLIYLLAPMQTSPEAKSYIALLDDSVKGLTRISTQMLKFHRDNNRPTQFKLGELLCEISDVYRPEAQKQDIVLIQCIETEGIILGYRSELIQVFSNLLLNALEATPIGGKIHIHLYPAPPWLCRAHNRCGYCLSVADTGSGIAPEHYARIFEPFFTTKGDKGTGLGLWLCRDILNRVTGSIRVWSTRRPGRSGTCFSVFLPAEETSFTPLRRRYERDASAHQT